MTVVVKAIERSNVRDLAVSAAHHAKAVTLPGSRHTILQAEPPSHVPLTPRDGNQGRQPGTDWDFGNRQRATGVRRSHGVAGQRAAPVPEQDARNPRPTADVGQTRIEHPRATFAAIGHDLAGRAQHRRNRNEVPYVDHSRESAVGTN